MAKFVLRVGQVIYAFLFTLLFILIPMNFLFDEIIKFGLIVMIILMLPFFIISLRWEKYEKEWQDYKEWCMIDKNL